MQVASIPGGRSLRRGLLVSALLLVVGCGSGGTITGKVTYKDKPVKRAQVSFLTEKGKLLTGSTDDEGTYTIKKVPPGPVKIAVLPKEPPRGMGGGPRGMPKDRKINLAPPDAKLSDEEKQRREAALKPDPNAITNFPPKYKDPEKSGLTFTVEKGEQTHDIPLDPAKK